MIKAFVLKAIGGEKVIIAYCVFSIFIWISVCIRIWKKNKDFLHIMIVFILFYVLNYPIKMIASVYGIHLIDSNKIGEQYQLLAMIISDIFSALIVFVFSKHIYIKVGHGKVLARKYKFSLANIYFSLLYIFFGLLSYGFVSFARMLSRNLMVEYRAISVTSRLGNGFRSIFVVGMDVCIFALIHIGINALKNRRLVIKLLFILEIVIFTWYSYSNTLSKTSLFLPVISCVIAYQTQQLREGKQGIPIKFVLVAAILGLLAVSIVELSDVVHVSALSQLEDILYMMIKSFFVPSFDAPDNLTAILYRIENVVIGDMAFLPFLYNLFLSKIPRTIWTSKYPGNGKLMIVEKFLPEFFVDYTNYNQASPSLVGDAIVSGGLIFIPFITVVYGVLFYNIYRRAKETNDLIPNIMFLFLVTNMNNFCRGGSDIIGNLIWMGIISHTVCYIYLCGVQRFSSRIGVISNGEYTT